MKRSIMAVLLAAGILGASIAVTRADPGNFSREQHEIYMLTAYGVVLNDWQNATGPGSRGHNIGGILVNATGGIVRWDRNCVSTLRNSSQHGEIRTITGFQSDNRIRFLGDYTLYTTLEPCAMCSGMILMTQMGRTVFGQSDGPYGNTIARLALNSTALGGRGFDPYPNAAALRIEPSQSAFRLRLEHFYNATAAQHHGSTTTFLRLPITHETFGNATQVLRNYPEANPAVNATKQTAIHFLDHVLYNGTIPTLIMSNATRQ